MSILSTFLSHHIRFDFKRFVSKKTNYREGGGNCIIKINIHLKPKLKSYFLIQDRNSIEIHRMKLCQWCDVVYGDTETLSNVQMCVVCAFVQFVHCVIRLTLWKLWGARKMRGELFVQFAPPRTIGKRRIGRIKCHSKCMFLTLLTYQFTSEATVSTANYSLVCTSHCPSPSSMSFSIIALIDHQNLNCHPKSVDTNRPGKHTLHIVHEGLNEVSCLCKCSIYNLIGLFSTYSTLFHSRLWTLTCTKQIC